MKQRFEDKIRIRQAQNVLAFGYEQLDPADCEPQLPGLAKRQFDFYGLNVRLAHQDRDRFVGDILLQEKEAEIVALKGEVRYHTNQKDEIYDLYSAAQHEEMRVTGELTKANAALEKK